MMMTLKDVLKKYRQDNNISDAVWYGICKHYTRGTNPNYDVIRHYLSPYYLHFSNEMATDKLIKEELLRFIEEYNNKI